MIKINDVLSPPNAPVGGPDANVLDARQKHSGMTEEGQSTVEYILLVTAVIAVAIAFTSPEGPFRQRFNNVIDQTTNGMGNMADRLMGAINPPPPPSPD